MTLETDDQAAAAPEAMPSVRDSLGAAFDAYDAANPDDGAGAPAAAAPAPQPAPAAPAAPAEGQAAQPRAADGKFAKPGEAPQTKPNSQPNASPAPAEPQAGTIRIPPGLSAATKAVFPTLPQHVQEDLLKWQRDVETAKTTWDQKGERLNRLDAVLAPRQEQFRLAGLDDVRAIETLFAAQDYLQRDPASALIYLGRQSGVNWQAVFAQLQGQRPQGQPAPMPPQLAPLVSHVQSLTTLVAQQQAAAESQKMQGHLDAVSQFAADPKHVYFENVRGRMRALIHSETAKDLEDAYQQACWSDPQIRPLMIQAQDQERQAAATAAASAKAAQARHASGSITGSPTPGATPGGRGPASATLRDAISAAWDEHA